MIMQMKYTARTWQYAAAFTPSDCQAIIDTHFKKEAVAEAMTGDLVNQSVNDHRKTNICWIPENDPVVLYLFNQALIANSKANWGFEIDSCEQGQLGEYTPGGHYDWHADEEFFNKEKGKHRKVSLVMQLSDPDTYEGGDLLVGLKEEARALRQQGSIIVFPSEMQHKVTPVIKGTRYSIVLWASGPVMR
jgi:PKHD-type hydroxylase